VFTKDFFWGAASASYQIEGAWNEDGKGLSIWDTFCHTPGKIKNGDTGDVACDHYHRFREDVAIMKEMGLQAYRFSISWPRLIPQGTGEVNEAGVKFYSDLVDALLEAGITPYATLYHWDLPQALQDKGGWINPDSPLWFAEYTELVARRLGDRVKCFFTLNEPSVFIKGIINGVHAPGLLMDAHARVHFFHNLLRAHGLAAKTLRRIIPGVRVGAAPAILPYIPEEESPENIEACRSNLFATRRVVNGVPVKAIDTFINVPSNFLDPICRGTYSEDCLAVIGEYLPENWEADMEDIHQLPDFLGFNCYQGNLARAGKNGGIDLVPKKVGYPRTAIDWQIQPQCLYWVARFLYERYGLPVMITENGISCHDAVSLDGKVHDPNRIDYLNRHLLHLERAVDEGVPVLGYFQWSIMDNLEWARGYFDRFGLVYVDFETQERIIKDSGRWYRRVIETNGAYLHAFETEA